MQQENYLKVVLKMDVQQFFIEGIGEITLSFHVKFDDNSPPYKTKSADLGGGYKFPIYLYIITKM